MTKPPILKENLNDFENKGLIQGKNEINPQYALNLIWKTDTIDWNIPINYQYVNPKSGEEKRSLIISDGVYSSFVNSTLSFQKKDQQSIHSTASQDARSLAHQHVAI